MKKGWKAGISAALAGLLVLAGCGNSESSSGESSEKTYKIGVTQFVEHPSLDSAYEGFQQAFKDKGLEVDFNVQNAQGDQNNNQTIANNFVGDEVDLIFANSTPSALSSLNATKEIPIVFTSVTDPVGAKLVESLESPDANITGTTDSHPDAIPNTIKFIDQYVEGKKVGMVYNSGEQNSVAQIEQVKKAMEGTDLSIEEASVSSSAEVKQAAESLVGKVDSLYIITDNTVVSALESVIGVAEEHKIPLFVGELDSVARGGFAAYGFDYFDIGYEAGELAVQILEEGKDPSELAVQYPQKLKLQINKKAAEAMGIELQDDWEEKAEYIE
ncbi:ABC transporter substrate-binding protein [Metabacillus arenae]|uniref:ABC transporter substrate-binding protein n=1 Tax=Metabacillus arenae TaxID=2771434 RepID=A0A926NAM6_9BACI|nr:ABC transporter substrate-binding protein [Metabacillus arenae]MBD1380677.1 ABC transporter substrate-binding protein [Metabacillus arenae]